MPSPYDLSRPELAALLEAEPAYRVDQVWAALANGVLPEAMTELPRALRARLAGAAPPALSELDRRLADGGRTVKWLWSTPDETRLESVVMEYPRRVTVCVSSQAGCAMGCGFCATGQGGFFRQLSAGEILEQVAAAMRSVHPRRLSHVVFMGMGEPLANYERVWAAIERLHDHFGLSARRLTVSTVGVVPGIRRLAGERLPVNLAVSLHAANDALRDELVPLNRRYPLSVLTEACAAYREASGRRLSFEWALIDGVNDRRQDAEELAGIARPLGAHVNLIPLNPTPGFGAVGSPPPTVERFRRHMGALGVNATVRDTRGRDISAACGQLAAPAPRAAPSPADRGGPTGAPVRGWPGSPLGEEAVRGLG